MQLFDFKETDTKLNSAIELRWFEKVRAIEHAELKGNVLEPDSSQDPIPVEFRLFTCKNVVKNKIMFAAVCQRRDALNFKNWTEIDVIENIKTEDEAKNIIDSWTAYLQGSFIPDGSKVNSSKYPAIPEEDGITHEWLEQVIEIDPAVTLEITVFDKQPGYHVFYSKPEFPFPLAVSAFSNILDMEEHIRSAALDSMIWNPAQARWSPKAARMRYIYHKKYTSEELAACDPDTLKRIAHVKQIPKTVDGIAIIERILNHQSAVGNFRI